MIRAFGLLLVASLLVAAPPAAPAAVAAGPDSVALEGRGYGHGRGMSQHGAQSAASLHGRSYREILGFYYPGLELGSARGTLRVLISGDTTADVVVRDRRRLRVRAVGSGKSWGLQRPDAERWRLTAGSGGATVVSVFVRRWERVRTIGGVAEFTAGGGPITLVTPSGPVRYQGALRSASGPSGRETVNVVRVESYLRGVVPLEVPALWHRQAVAAQSVAARTYALYHRAHPRASHYDLCDTTSCQVYGGYSARHQASDAAIAATAGEVLRHNGSPAFTEFSSSNGGWTVAGDKPYQVAEQDHWDPAELWQVRLTDDQLERAFPAIGDFQRLRVMLRDGNGAWGGRVLRIRVVGDRAARTVDGDDFRSALGLRSTWFRPA